MRTKKIKHDKSLCFILSNPSLRLHCDFVKLSMHVHGCCYCHFLLLSIHFARFKIFIKLSILLKDASIQVGTKTVFNCK